jgi:predicted amidohydrolase YtcJ
MRKPDMRYALLMLTCVAVGSAPAGERADRAFLNGRIWTGEDGKAVAEAMAIRGDRILLVGSNAKVRESVGSDTAITDMKGCIVVPGFNDAHWHFHAAEKADLIDVRDVKDIQSRLLEFAKAHPGTGWIAGFGWGYAAFPDLVPHRKYLDSIIPNRPVFISPSRRDRKPASDNTKAARRAQTAPPCRSRELPNESGIIGAVLDVSAFGL